MEVFVDGNSFERLAVRYSEEERQAAILAIRLCRESILYNDESYDDLEALRILMEVSFQIEDELLETMMVSRETDDYIRQHYLPGLVRAARNGTRYHRENAWKKLDVTPEQLYVLGATAIELLDDTKMPDIILSTPATSGGEE